MLKLKFKVHENRLYISEHEIAFPFSSFSYGDKKVLWNLNSIESKGIQGNFRLLYRRKLDFSGIQTNGNTKKIENLTYINDKYCGVVGTTQIRHILLSKRFLLFYDEK